MNQRQQERAIILIKCLSDHLEARLTTGHTAEQEDAFPAMEWLYEAHSLIHELHGLDTDDETSFIVDGEFVPWPVA